MEATKEKMERYRRDHQTLIMKNRERKVREEESRVWPANLSPAAAVGETGAGGGERGTTTPGVAQQAGAGSRRGRGPGEEERHAESHPRVGEAHLLMVGCMPVCLPLDGVRETSSGGSGQPHNCSA